MKKIPDEIREYLSYDPTLGKFVWEKSYANNVKAFKMIGQIDKDGYLIIPFKCKRYRAHRVAWFMHYNKQPKKILDHINGNKLDNSISNLREVTNRENVQNRWKLEKDGLLGAKYRKFTNSLNKWESRILINKKSVYLGVFATELEAHEAYMNKLSNLDKTG